MPVSVNYHFNRKCNYEYSFCFHTEKTSFVLDDKRKLGLILLKKAGMRKLNFAGGEPFLYPKKLAGMCRYAKEELKIKPVSIVSNGSLIRKEWIANYVKYIIDVSCDSYNPETNIKIGRGTKGR